MLHIHKPTFEFPEFHISGHMELSPVIADDDELIRDIEAQQEVWTLDAVPDTEGLDRFWTEVQEDLHANPEGSTLE